MVSAPPRTARRRFALIGIDLVQASPGDIDHLNVGGGELIVVDVTDPAKPRDAGRAPGHDQHPHRGLRAATATAPTPTPRARQHGTFSIFDLRNLDQAARGGRRTAKAGVQPFARPPRATSGTSTRRLRHPHRLQRRLDVGRHRPACTRGWSPPPAAGRPGTDPKHPGWNDFILHNSYRPNATAFGPSGKPSLEHGNVLLVTEEDYEQTDCSKAGSFQTWWVKRLDGTKEAIVPLDKVELADLGNFPLPQGAFCSSHWFDSAPAGIVAAGFYGGGTQLIDVREPAGHQVLRLRHLGRLRGLGHRSGCRSTGTAWPPSGSNSNVVYSIDAVRGLDVYAVDVPGTASVPDPPTSVVPTLGGIDRARTPRCRSAGWSARWHSRSPYAVGRAPRPAPTHSQRGTGTSEPLL